MRRRLKQESFLRKAIVAAIALCFFALSTIIGRGFAQTIQNGDKVEENTELTYYLTATADGIDAYGEQLAQFKEKMVRQAGSFVIDEAAKERRYQPQK